MSAAASVPSPRGAVFGPEFHTAAGPFRAGTAFAVWVPEVNAPVLLTCQHLFGPPGGVSEWVPSELMARFVERVVLRDRWSDAVVGHAGSGVVLPGARSAEPGADVAAFVLAPQPNVQVLRFAERAPETEAPVFLVARVVSGAATDELLHAATALGAVGHDAGTEWIRMNDESVQLAPASGAPVLDARGEVVGMVVRGKPEMQQIIAAKQIRALVAAVVGAA